MGTGASPSGRTLVSAVSVRQQCPRAMHASGVARRDRIWIRRVRGNDRIKVTPVERREDD